MISCGLKLTHDGSIAVIEDGRLLFSIELEKINNNPRYSEIDDTCLIESILAREGLSTSDIDHFAVDGWGGYDQDALAIQPRLTIGDRYNEISVKANGKPIQLKVGHYEERFLKENVLKEYQFDGLVIGNRFHEYSSYLHVTDHILSSYCTSPFAKRNESSYILVWDGGMYPRLYYFDATRRAVDNLGPLFLLVGNIYTIFSQHFGPFKVKGGFAKDDLSVAGKVMAYVALGKLNRDLFDHFDGIYRQVHQQPMGFANVFANQIKQVIAGLNIPDEDVLLSFHTYLQELLLEKLQKKVERSGGGTRNFCFAGGCALNIKWNNAIRRSKIFDEVYIPPFPNDSGSAIGAACASMITKQSAISVDWNVYSGPSVIKNEPAAGWTGRHCSIPDLALLLHQLNQPVIFLNGRAELGPRALGNRSIIAPATSGKMKDILNDVKRRETYRPVSPICLEARSIDVFEPGSSDPYMLFDHQVRPEWKEKILAICHLDGSARLQTVNFTENKEIAELLVEYEKVSGIPLLCNTSANLNGSGFFPDVYSATDWNKVNFVWCDSTLFEREQKLELNF